MPRIDRKDVRFEELEGIARSPGMGQIFKPIIDGHIRSIVDDPNVDKTDTLIKQKVGQLVRLQEAMQGGLQGYTARRAEIGHKVIKTGELESEELSSARIRFSRTQDLLPNDPSRLKTTDAEGNMVYRYEIEVSANNILQANPLYRDGLESGHTISASDAVFAGGGIAVNLSRERVHYDVDSEFLRSQTQVSELLLLGKDGKVVGVNGEHVGAQYFRGQKHVLTHTHGQQGATLRNKLQEFFKK